MKYPVLVLLVLICTFFIYSEDIALSGIDSSMLPVTGRVRLYAVVTDNSGNLKEGLDGSDFTVIERNPENGEEVYRDVLSFSSSGEPRNGMVFMLLIDDSGSMYNKDSGETYAFMARKETRKFLEETANSMDRIGLSFFGTRCRIAVSPMVERAGIISILSEKPEKPESTEAYTDLFGAVIKSSECLSKEKGRRIIILFSDGQDFPYYSTTGKAHPEYGEKSYTPEEALESLLYSGITLYAVRFGSQKDEDLKRIALATGGLVFDIDSLDNLDGLYDAIRKRVYMEYRISFMHKPGVSERTFVRLRLNGKYDSNELFFQPGLFIGHPADFNHVLFSFVSFIIAALIIYILLKSGRSYSGSGASLEKLKEKNSAVNIKAKTVISLLPDRSGTVFTDTSAAVNDITIEKRDSGRWIAESDTDFTVNNMVTKEIELKDGDVIKAGGDVIVFTDDEN